MSVSERNVQISNIRHQRFNSINPPLGLPMNFDALKSDLSSRNELC